MMILRIKRLHAPSGFDAIFEFIVDKLFVSIVMLNGFLDDIALTT